MEIMSKHPRTLLSLSASALVSVVALLFVAPGCSDDPTGEDACHDYSTFKSDSKVVSFKTDVLPLFRRSCGFAGSCHGSQTPPKPDQPFLGPPMLDPAPDQMTIDKIFTQNVGVTSQKSTLKIVEAGSPQKSFLMHKMDNTLTCPDAACENCGVLMPLGATAPLAAAERDIVRLWIAQGAKND
jgi:hypothetical protein